MIVIFLLQLQPQAATATATTAPNSFFSSSIRIIGNDAAAAVGSIVVGCLWLREEEKKELGVGDIISTKHEHDKQHLAILHHQHSHKHNQMKKKMMMLVEEEELVVLGCVRARAPARAVFRCNNFTRANLYNMDLRSNVTIILTTINPSYDLTW